MTRFAVAAASFIAIFASPAAAASLDAEMARSLCEMRGASPGAELERCVQSYIETPTYDPVAARALRICEQAGAADTASCVSRVQSCLTMEGVLTIHRAVEQVRQRKSDNHSPQVVDLSCHLIANGQE